MKSDMPAEQHQGLQSESPSEQASVKRNRIIQAARDAFMASGFAGTSMDIIARGAGVSKATLYAHFTTKDALFLAVMQAERAVFARALDEFVMSPDLGLREALTGFGLRFLHFIMRPASMTLFWIIIAESSRFPELGRAVFRSGHEDMQVPLERMIEAGVTRGVLIKDNIHEMAGLFLALVKGNSHFRCLLDRDFTTTEANMDDQVARAVDIFLRYYGTDAAAR